MLRWRRWPSTSTSASILLLLSVSWSFCFGSGAASFCAAACHSFFTAMTSPLGIFARYTVPDDPAPTMPSLPSTDRATSSAVKLSLWNAVIRHGPTTTSGRAPPTLPPLGAAVPSSPHWSQRAVTASTAIPANATAAAATHIAAVCRAESPSSAAGDDGDEPAGARWLKDTSKVSSVVQLVKPGGTVPVSAFQDRSTSVMDGRAASSAGISPVSWLCCSLKLTSRLHLPMSSGIAPVSSFPSNSSRYKFEHPVAPNAGTSLSSAHLLAAKTCNFGACHDTFGSAPPTGLPEMLKYSRLGEATRSAGMPPVSELELRSR
uniref:Secreted protein n=1 Tax=Arundo donax TaxID=35708 RepID=A0A0A9CX31_ARUDO